MRAPSAGLLLRLLLPALGLVGAVLVALASSASVIEIDVLTTNELAADVDTRLTGMDRHGPALLLIAGFAALMLLGAVAGRARPAMLAVAVAGAVVLGIAGLSDGPALDETGEVGRLYEDASAQAGSGFYLETLGGALLLLSGGAMLLAGAPARPERRERPRRRDRGDAPDDAGAGAPPAPSRTPDDWFVDGPS